MKKKTARKLEKIDTTGRRRAKAITPEDKEVIDMALDKGIGPAQLMRAGFFPDITYSAVSLRLHRRRLERIREQRNDPQA